MCPVDNARFILNASNARWYTHTTIYVSSCYYICVLIQSAIYACPIFFALYYCVSSYYNICVLILLCPHTTIYASSCYYMCPTTMCVLILPYVSPHTTHCICAFILLNMCPHTTMCVCILLNVSSYYYLCSHTTICVSSYYSVSLLILLYLCLFFYSMG